MDFHARLGRGAQGGHAAGEGREEPRRHLAHDEGQGEAERGQDEVGKPGAPAHAPAEQRRGARATAARPLPTVVPRDIPTMLADDAGRGKA
jgi:hypothetical protein